MRSVIAVSRASRPALQRVCLASDQDLAVPTGQPVPARRLRGTGSWRVCRVSRSWIYQQPQLLAEISRLRQPSTDKRPGAAASQKATTDSLRQQLHAYREEIARLRAEITSLHEQLGRQLGAARTAAITSQTGNVKDMSTTSRP